MKLDLYQVDAFAEKVFEGNPAAVCPLNQWLPDDLMQKIAMENNLSETAFFVPADERFDLRWFTPEVEVDLCGHATLASAHVIFQHLDYRSDTIIFSTESGELKVEKKDDQLVMTFPVHTPRKSELPDSLAEALGTEARECYRAKDYLVILDSEEQVKELSPDFAILKKIETRGIIVSAPGSEVDFVSRFFAPAVGINEDPVTGSAHTTLVPYWSERLGKKELLARQISRRGGTIKCRMLDNQVELGGKAKTFMTGTIEIF